MLKAGIYQGILKHTRLKPIKHAFAYPLFMMMFDLDTLPNSLQKLSFCGHRPWHWARLRFADYLNGSARDAQQLKQLSCQLSGIDTPIDDIKVMMLCQLRYAGIYFSPLNLYFIYHTHGQWLRMLAEVSNTPWLEKHHYVIDANALNDGIHEHDKAFHVSPFSDMNQQYRWRVQCPQDGLRVSLSSHEEGPVFCADMHLKHQSFTSYWPKVLRQTPCQTGTIITSIYTQAYRLKRQGAIFHEHPKYHRSNDPS